MDDGEGRAVIGIYIERKEQKEGRGREKADEEETKKLREEEQNE